MKKNNKRIISSLNLSQNDFDVKPNADSFQNGLTIARYIMTFMVSITRNCDNDAVEALSFASDYVNDFFRPKENSHIHFHSMPKDILDDLQYKMNGYSIKSNRTMLQSLTLYAKEFHYSSEDTLLMITGAMSYFTLARRAYRIYRQAQSLNAKEHKMSHSEISDMISYCANLMVIQANYQNINKHMVQYDSYMYGPIVDKLKNMGIVNHIIKTPTPKKDSKKVTHRVKADTVAEPTSRRIIKNEEGNKNMNYPVKKNLVYKEEKAVYAFELKVQIPGISQNKNEIKIAFKKSKNPAKDSYIRIDIYKGNDFVEKGYQTISVPFGFIFKTFFINNGILKMNFIKENVNIPEYEDIHIF